nr:PREDICTED: olfactory receptor 51L1-like [Haliaeetus albicilla]
MVSCTLSCLHQDIIRVAQSHLCDIYETAAFMAQVFALSSMALDSLLLVLLYIMILKTVLSIASKKEQSRALNTCTSHVCAILIFDITVISLSMIHKSGKKCFSHCSHPHR